MVLVSEVPDHLLQYVCAHVVMGQQYDRQAYRAKKGPASRENEKGAPDMLLEALRAISGRDHQVEEENQDQALQEQYKVSKRAVGAWMATCKHFHKILCELEHQIGTGMRAAERTRAPPADMILRSNTILRLNYSRLFVLVEAGTAAPKVSLHAPSGEAGAVPPEQRAVCLKSGVKCKNRYDYDQLAEAAQQKDMFVVKLPMTSADTPPVAFVTRTWDDGPPIVDDGDNTFTNILKQRRTDPFRTYLPDDLYSVGDGYVPDCALGVGIGTSFHKLPDAMADVMAPGAIMVGTARAGCWYEAVGGVRIQLRDRPGTTFNGDVVVDRAWRHGAGSDGACVAQ